MEQSDAQMDAATPFLTQLDCVSQTGAREAAGETHHWLSSCGHVTLNSQRVCVKVARPQPCSSRPYV